MATTMDFRDSTFDDFKRPNLNICTNLQQKHCVGEQIFSVILELINNAHHIRKMDLRDLPQIWGGGGGGVRCYIGGGTGVAQGWLRGG